MNLQTLARATALASAGLVLAACTINTNPEAARVDCGTPGPHGVDCQVQRTGGNAGLEACWNLAISCRNGGGMTGSACHDMAAGVDKGSENMPAAGFSGQASCDVPVSGRVEQLKISSK